jgi:hippurate hydrolase
MKLKDKKCLIVLKKQLSPRRTAYGCTVNVRYEFGVSVTDNYVKNTEFAIEAAEAVVGANNIKTDIDPIMAGEDFSEMLAGMSWSIYIFR